MSISIMRIREIREGSIKANGSEQTVVEVSRLSSVYGWLDLSEMDSGDTVVIRYYVKIDRDGNYKKYAEDVFSNRQENPMVRFQPVVTRYGVKITVQQTSGSFKNFRYQFFIGMV